MNSTADDAVDVVVIGGGVVGLAAAGTLAEAGRSVALLERHPAFGREISSRNSEVVHAGLYYPAGSLKARHCVEGARRLYAFCRAAGVRHENCGKLVVAADDVEAAELERLKRAGETNGVSGLALIDGAELARREPAAAGRLALVVPSTGILNAHGLVDALAVRAEAAGALLVRGAGVFALEPGEGGRPWRIGYRDGAGEDELFARVVVNAAGLGAQAVMRMAGMDPDAAGLRRWPCRGVYFSVAGRWRGALRGLVYPVPPANLTGLGIHSVKSLDGGFKLGPDTEYVDRDDDFTVDPGRRNAFYEAARRYLPDLREDELSPDMAGIRPKLSGPGEAARDFYMAHEAARGLPGFVNLAGLESPALTACLSLADGVRDLAAECLD